MEALTRYTWPGDIRELQNLIERAVVLSPGPGLRFPLRYLQTRPPATLEVKPVKTLAEAEREHILVALKEVNWVLSDPRVRLHGWV